LKLSSERIIKKQPSLIGTICFSLKYEIDIRSQKALQVHHLSRKLWKRNLQVPHQIWPPQHQQHVLLSWRKKTKA
jgi:hypothetical protein